MANTMPAYQQQMRMPPQQYPVYGNSGRYVNGNSNYMPGNLGTQNSYFRPQQQNSCKLNY